jgi:class 3 adenylate cyclase/Tfp pilus assembly protein PilF
LFFLCLANVGRSQTASTPFIRACLDSCARHQEAGRYPEALTHLARARRMAEEQHDTLQMASLLVRSSEVYQLVGDNNGALSDLYKALEFYEATGDRNGLAKVYNNIGTVHHYDGDLVKARRFYGLSLDLRQQEGSPAERAQVLNNLGSLLEDQGLPDSAIIYHHRSLGLRIELGDSVWVPITYAHLGSCYNKLDNTDSAMYYLRKSLGLIRDGDNRYLENHVRTKLGMAYLRAGQPQKALVECTQAMSIAEGINSLPALERSTDCLQQVYSALGRDADALAMLRRHIAVRDSMFSQERARELTRIELTHGFRQQRFADSLMQVEEQRRTDLTYREGLAREREEKRLLIFGWLAVALLAGGLWHRLRYMRRSRNDIQRERERSERLLLNILPKPIAEELKENGRAKARDVDRVSILFTDFHQFTRLSEELDAQQLVLEIDTCYRAFDAICIRHGVEKIKTIGDSYMCAGGLPEPQPDSALRTVLAALEMQDWIRHRAAEREADGLPAFRMRAGIHTGPVVAGIVGDTKFQYDIWGDTVNIAARMESNGEVGEVNISSSTREQLGERPPLRFVPRGILEVKGKGAMEMFFVYQPEAANKGAVQGTTNATQAAADLHEV